MTGRLAVNHRMSHTYDAKDALRVYEKLNGFIEPLKSLAHNLKEASAT